MLTFGAVEPFITISVSLTPTYGLLGVKSMWMGIK